MQHCEGVPGKETRGESPRRAHDADRHLRGRAPPQRRPLHLHPLAGATGAHCQFQPAPVPAVLNAWGSRPTTWSGLRHLKSTAGGAAVSNATAPSDAPWETPDRAVFTRWRKKQKAIYALLMPVRGRAATFSPFRSKSAGREPLGRYCITRDSQRIQCC